MIGSYRTLVSVSGNVLKLMFVNNTVPPSAFDLATTIVPIWLPPPGLLSTIKVSLRTNDIRSERIRAAWITDPPDGIGHDHPDDPWLVSLCARHNENGECSMQCDEKQSRHSRHETVAFCSA